MFRRPIALVFVFLLFRSFTVAGAPAQGGPPPPDATPGAAGFGNVLLVGSARSLPRGTGWRCARTLSPRRVRHPPHASDRHHCLRPVRRPRFRHPGRGRDGVTRGGTGKESDAVEALELNAEIILELRDCVAFDKFAARTKHTGWNASDGTTVVWETRLLRIGEPYTTFVDEQGTQVATPLP